MRQLQRRRLDLPGAQIDLNLKEGAEGEKYQDASKKDALLVRRKCLGGIESTLKALRLPIYGPVRSSADRV
jgi:hypothetical protein